ncbi:hypothetical protein [Micromonospora sp. NPDC023633]|uniref:hypothetical protein n=1 Tax=Micromonospora sp. NPDC023633 TaxID=3154320 RepID=UPI0033EB7AAE
MTALAAFSSSQRIRQTVTAMGRPGRTTVRTVHEPLIASAPDGGGDGHVVVGPGTALSDLARDHLLRALGVRSAVMADAAALSRTRECPDAGEPAPIDVSAFLASAERHGVEIRQVTVSRYESNRWYRAPGAAERVCAHTWSSLRAEPAAANGTPIEIFWHAAIRLDRVLDAARMLVAGPELPVMNGRGFRRARLTPDAMTVLLSSLTSAYVRRGAAEPPGGDARFVLRTCEADLGVPFGHCFDLDGVDTSVAVLSGPGRQVWPKPGETPQSGVLGHRTTQRFAPVPVSRPGAVTLEGDQIDDGSVVAGYSGLVVTQLAEHGASHLLEGSGFFLRARGLVLDAGRPVGRWGPITMALRGDEVIGRLLRVFSDGGFSRMNDLTVRRFWADMEWVDQ